MTPRFLLRTRALCTALLLGALPLALTACDSGDSDDDDDGSSSPVSLRADGELVEFVGGGASIVSGQLSLGAADTGGDPSAGFIVEPAEGTYSIAGDDVFAFYSVDGDSYTAVSGTVTIESLDDDSMRGTFEFDAESDSGDEIEITDGRFDVEVF